MGNLKFIKSRKIKTLLSIKRNEKPIDFSEEIQEQDQEEHLAEYNETLNAEKQSLQTPNIPQTIVRDLSGIENNVDSLHRSHEMELETDLERKVDAALSNKRETTKRKPSNVIYVVSKPQPGQVKGDWAVRSHGKIFSHHRTKQAAIAKAREIARKREATVMVQNTDGTFSSGFKPRPK